MAFKRYKADADNTIVNTFKPGFKLRATGSNAGYADVMEVYSIYGREASGSQELSRILVKFPVSSISTDRTAGTIPASGSVSFYLKLYNAQHSKTVPESFTLLVSAVSQSWQEGVGLDLETYQDDTKGNEGSNWMSASNTAAWTNVGGDYLTGSGYLFSQSFETGLEDLEVDITSLVENWIDGTQENYGVGVHLTSSQEAYYSSSTGLDDGGIIHNTGGATTSYYTKRFFARGSQYFFKRPIIEARWDSSTRDDRGNFYYSSSLAPAEDNLNTLYLYNYVRGRLRNIPGIGTGAIYVDLYSGSANNSGPSGSALNQSVSTPATGGYVSTGIYSCSVSITAASTPITTLFDVWYSGSTQYFTGTIKPVVQYASQTATKLSYYINITNLKSKYNTSEAPRFNLYVRNKNWSPSIYTVSRTDPPSTIIQSASYRVYRLLDAYEAIEYGTGSDAHTVLSYDISGSYFDFDMSVLEPGYGYAFKFSFYDPELSSWIEQPQTFKFRVEDYEY